ncbi:MAG: hypothetical protein LUH05_04040 [Candidatus Gastranaerophilales bacterium]|nr:hypothetical protein [Candidatus Gastranaerophilales bacterium]
MNEKEKEERILHLQKEIRKALGGANLSYTALANILEQKKDAGQTNITTQSLTQKIKRGMLPYIEVEEVANILGYEIIWKEKEV